MKVGVLTGGGDAPGLNGIVESVTRALCLKGHEVIGICDGFEGIFQTIHMPLLWETVEGVHAKAGTLLGTSNKSRTKGREAEFLKGVHALGLDVLVAAGGDGTFQGLSPFMDKLPIIGVPKTIDNDLAGTDITFGFDTACSVVAEAVDALRATADAHRRTIFVETMGRNAGWIALGGGLASYADAILLPERPFLLEALAAHIKHRRAKGQRGIICVVSEGAHAQGSDVQVAFEVPNSPESKRLGGVSETLARWCDHHMEEEARHVILGHLQRSHPPTTTDRFLTLAMGVEVARMVEDRAFGQAVVYRQGRVQRAPIGDFLAPAKTVSAQHSWVQMAQALGIFI